MLLEKDILKVMSIFVLEADYKRETLPLKKLMKYKLLKELKGGSEWN